MKLYLRQSVGSLYASCTQLRRELHLQWKQSPGGRDSLEEEEHSR